MTLTLDQTGIAALVWVASDIGLFEPTLRSLRASHRDLEIVVGYFGDEPDLGFDAGVELLNRNSLSEAISEVSREWNRHVLLVTGPVIVPPDVLDFALPALHDDMRIGTVSFLSNAAGYLSIPNRNSPSSHQVGPHDEVSITHLLRTIQPPGRMTPIPVPAGPITLISRHALSTVDGLLDLPATTAFLTAEFAMRSARRGFLSVVDSNTYVTRAMDMLGYAPEPMDNSGSVEQGAMVDRHGYIGDVYAHERDSDDSPLGLSIRVASSKVRGLQIIIDGSDVGPKEMGTQVHILNLVRSLAARDDVDRVDLGLPGPVPGYARPFLESTKVRPFHAPGLNFDLVENADIVHRPAQPNRPIPLDHWRWKGARVVISLLDLIAYQVGVYSGDGPSWLHYRNSLAGLAAAADGVLAISHDTRRHIERENLAIEQQRLFVVECGTDHLSGDEPGVIPNELVRRGFQGEEFLLVLGTNNSHKNRDLAIRAWKLLQYSFPQLHLVLVGAFVPSGSSRLDEARADRAQSRLIHVLPDVTSTERNWLLARASALIYPTSAEGFGLVPFEAGRFGTPCVGISFGPLAELNPDPPVHAASWRPEDIAEAIGSLLADPELARAHVQHTMRNGERFTWDRAAEGHVDAYRRLLSLPKNRRPFP